MRLATLLLLAAMLAIAGWISWRSPHHFAQQDRIHIAASASKEFPAGTDELGRDRAERLAVAVLLSLGGAALASTIAAGASVGLGLGASLSPLPVRSLLLYTGDLFLSLPSLFLLMLVRSALPLSLAPLRSGLITFLLLALLGVPAFLRVNEQSSSSLLQTNWFLQSRAAGLRWIQLCRQLLPHMQRLFWTQFLLFVPTCLIAEANLGTLGLGLPQPLPSLGNFLAGLQSDMLLNVSALNYLPVVVLTLALVAMELTIFGEQR